jgi:hypothetical protein
MKSEEIAEYVKALNLTPDSILVIDRAAVDIRDVTQIRLAPGIPRVPILAVDGVPSIAAFTRDQLAEALRLIDAGE